MKTFTIDFRAMTRWLRVLFTPSIWICLGVYSREWDTVLRSLMQTGRFESIDEFTARIGGIEVWVANRPYGCMRIYQLRPTEVRPSRATILEALDKYDRDVIADMVAGVWS